jgi:biopolymer transport protein ExbB
VGVLFDAFVAIRDFMELGGPMLNAIAIAILVMWILIFERLFFLRTELPKLLSRERDAWEGRQERKSWYAHRVREASISRIKLAATDSIPLIKTLVALCPLLGLMGTVTGMVEVFDVLALSGAGNARSMAAGVSRATIPTMAGMVGALIGLFAVTLLSRAANREIELFDEALTTDH